MSTPDRHYEHSDGNRAIALGIVGSIDIRARRIGPIDDGVVPFETRMGGLSNQCWSSEAIQPSPNPMFKWLKFRSSFLEDCPLDPLHEITRIDERRARHQQMDEVPAHVSFEDLNCNLWVYVPHELPGPESALANEQLGARYYVFHSKWNLMSNRVGEILK